MDPAELKVECNFYNESNFVYFGIDGKNPNVNGKDWWNKTTKSKKPKTNQNIGILTGSKSNITVVDIDVKDDGKKVWDEIVQSLNIPNTPIVETGSGGYHYYFKYNDTLNNGGSKQVKADLGDGIVSLGIDVMNNSKQVVAPPSIHPITGQTYKWKNRTNELAEIPDVLLKLLLKQTYLKYSKRSKKYIIKKMTADDHSGDDDNIIENNDLKDIESLVMGLDKKRSDDYDDWWKVIAVLAREAKEKSIDLTQVAIKFSQQSDKYENDNVLALYNNILTGENNSNNKLTIKTLWKWLKHDDPNLFRDLQAEIKYRLETVEDQAFSEIFQSIQYDPRQNELQYSDYMKFYQNRNKEVDEKELAIYFKECIIHCICGGNDLIFTKKKLADGTVEYYQPPKTLFTGINDFKILHKGKYEKFSALFTKYYMSNYYLDVDFLPYLDKNLLPRTTFNLFGGFRFKYEKKEYKEPADCLKTILYHIREVICAGNEKNYHYLIRWVAHMFQKPFEKVGVAVLLQSDEQGNGKNSFATLLIKLLGMSLIYQTDQMRDITNNFNSMQKGKLLFVLNEVANYSGHKNNDILKSKITEDIQRVEPKGKEAFLIRCFIRLLLTSNCRNPMLSDKYDRRLFALEVSNIKVGDREYFAQLHKDINDEAVLKEFFDYVVNIDLTGWDHRTIPMTNLKIKLVSDSFSASIRYLVDLGNNERPRYQFNGSDIMRIKAISLYEDYRDWCHESNDRLETRVEFLRKMSEVELQKKSVRSDGEVFLGFIIVRQTLELSLRKYMKNDEFKFEPALDENVDEEDDSDDDE
jgi:hypothetical protein